MVTHSRRGRIGGRTPSQETWPTALNKYNAMKNFPPVPQEPKGAITREKLATTNQLLLFAREFRATKFVAATEEAVL